MSASVYRPLRTRRSSEDLRAAAWLPRTAMVLACAASMAGVGMQLTGHAAEAPDSGERGMPVSASSAPENLFARCTRAMVQGSCQVMGALGRAPGPASPASARVFVAGVGEVDAAVYERLRSQGEAMCSELQRECVQDWNSSACRIAQALYPSAD